MIEKEPFSKGPLEQLTSPASTRFVPRPERNHGTGRLMPHFDLSESGEGPVANHSVDGETLIKQISYLASQRPTGKKRGRYHSR